MSAALLRQRVLLVFFGVLLSLVLLETGLRAAGFIFLALQKYRNHQALSKPGAFRILCVGESTTALGGENSYPRQLERILNERDSGRSFRVVNGGVPGCNTNDIMADLAKNLETYRPDAVVAMMGVNDSGNPVEFEAGSGGGRGSFWNGFRAAKLSLYLWKGLQGFSDRRRYEKALDGSVRPQDRVSLSVGEQAGELKGQRKGKGGGNNSPRAEVKSGCSERPETAELLSEAQILKRTGEREKAQKVFRRITEKDPGCVEAYLEMSDYHEVSGRLGPAAAMLSKALQLNPHLGSTYCQLSKIYLQMNDREKSMAVLEEGLRHNPGNGDIEGLLVLLRQGGEGKRRSDASLKELRSAPEDSHKKITALMKAMRSLGEDGKHDEALSIAEELYRQDPDNARIAGALAVWSLMRGDTGLAGRYFEETYRLRMKTYNETTRINYLRLYRELRSRGVSLVAVQYPVRSVGPLKKILSPFGEDIIFVDNEKSFRRIIKAGSGYDYFGDFFAGDFGHCTPSGNRLLAENVADTLLDNASRLIGRKDGKRR